MKKVAADVSLKVCIRVFAPCRPNIVNLRSGSFFVSPCPPECYLQSETKNEPELRLAIFGLHGAQTLTFYISCYLRDSLEVLVLTHL